MVNVIAWVIAGLIDGWPLLIIEKGGEREGEKNLCVTNNIFLCVTRESKKVPVESVGGRTGGAPRQVGAILTAPSVMCVTSKPQLL